MPDSGKTMRSFTKLIQPWQIWSPAVVLLLLFALACGTSAPATAEPETTAPDTSAAAPTAAAAPAQPTAIPEPTAAAEVKVNPGKVTWMTGDLGAERFDVVFDSSSGFNNSGRFLHGALIATNEDTQLLPGIASDWSLSNDGLTWSFTIRKGVKFHDGTDLTAADVLWTWRHCFSPEALDWAINNSCQTIARLIDKTEQTGDKVSMTTSVYFPAFDSDRNSEAGNVSGILPRRDKLHDEAAEAAFDKNPIGAGVMRLVKHVPAEVMEFERFDDYYYQPANGFPEDRRMKFTSLDLRVAPEEATRVAALRAGEADIAPVSLQARKQVEAGGGRLVFGQEGVYWRVRLLGCFDPFDFPCKDRRVRQALNYALDKESIQQLMGGPEVMQFKGWYQVTPSTIGYSPEVDPFPFDPDKARQLLAEAGYPNGEGFGKLIVNTWTSSSMPYLPESAQLAADFWRRELGIDAEVRVGDEVSLKKVSKSGGLKGEILWRDDETRIDASKDMRQVFGNPDRKDQWHNDPELYALVDQTLEVLDPEEAPKALNQLFRRLRDESYVLGVGYVNIPWAVGPRIATWQPWPLAFFPSNLHGITLK